LAIIFGKNWVLEKCNLHRAQFLYPRLSRLEVACWIVFDQLSPEVYYVDVAVSQVNRVLPKDLLPTSLIWVDYYVK